MDRRAYLTALGVAAAALSGCSQGDRTTSESDTPTGSEPTEPTPTATPEPTPQVADAGLLLDRGQYAALDRTIRSVGQGGDLILGVEYSMPVNGGAVRGLVETRVFDDAGERVDTNTMEVSAVADGDSASREAWFAFDTADWEQGSYTAEVLVNSEADGTTASTEVPFDVVEPLGPGEVELRLAEFPESAVADEEFTWTLGFRNLSDRDSSLVTDTLTLDPARADPVKVASETRENVPAGEEILVEEEITLNYPGSYTYRLDEVDAEFGFTISPAEE